MAEPSLLQRLKERKLVQWAVAYLAGAWILFEAADVVGGRWNLPDVLFQGLFITLAIGFLIILILAWFHGEKGQQRVSGPEFLAVLAVLVLGGVALSFIPTWEPPQGSIPGTIIPVPGEDDPRPSVAALPFANLSSDPADAFLADGIHQEVITQLQKIGGLRPISRTSVMGYREPAQNIRDVASELGVSVVLEGTVQKAGDRLRVTVQLIDPSSDEHLWAESFDREISMADLLDIQSEIARQIASALKLELAPEVEARLVERPTANLEAYQAFLRGRYFQSLSHYTTGDVGRAMEEFTRAVELDPSFALAWMELANAHAQEVFFWTDASEERIELARYAADRALEAGSPTPEVHLGLGKFYLWLERDPERALAEIALAEAGLPNKQAVYEARAYVFELQGRNLEGIQEFRKALNVSPLDPSVYQYLAHFYWLIREYEEAEAFADEGLALGPDQFWTNMTKVVVVWSKRGATPETREILDGMPHGVDWVAWARYWQRMMEDRFEEALAVLEEEDSGWIRTKLAGRPTVLFEALTYLAMGSTEMATGRFEAARIVLEKEIRIHPDDPRYHSSLGLAYAGLGMKEAAIREVEKAVELLPVSKDAVYGLPYLVDQASIHIMVGDTDEALKGVEELLTIPSWVSPAFLMIDTRFDPLHDNPRFQALLERYADDVEH